MGYRGVSDEDSVGYYAPIADELRELHWKICTVLHGIAALIANRNLLDPRLYPSVAFQLWTHKICRWLVPFAMNQAFVSNATLVGRHGYLAPFMIQFGLYTVACRGMSSGRLEQGRLFRLPAFLVLSNLSIVTAWYRYASGQRVVSWTPSDRSS